jgi:Xaa-Pro aminopeptidase
LHADALLVSHPANIRYLCGFTGSAGLLLVQSSKATLFTDSRYTFQAREEVSGASVSIAKKGLVKAVGEAMRRIGAQAHVGYSASHLTVAQKESLQAAGGGGIRWVKDASVIERLRAVKDREEIAIMRESAELISEVFRRSLPSVKPGISELELAGKIEYSMKQLGATGPSFETIVASGTRTAWAHARPTAKILKKNELVLLDHGTIFRGYCSDLTRTVYLGKIPPKVRRLYDAVLEAQMAAKNSIRPGVTAGEVDAAARGTLRKHKLAQYFTHSTGHGLGLEIHEMPRLGKGEKFVLQEGMVVTVEPGVYVEGVGGIRIEDDVVVSAQGMIELTNASRDLIEI